MVAYQFEPRHHEPILDGSKPFTLRANVKKRHARIGEEIQFLPGRAKPKFAIATCVYRATILFSEQGLAEIRDVQMADDGAAAALDYILQGARKGAATERNFRGKLAVADGFSTWDDLVRWHAAQDGPTENGLMVREVIGWTHITPVALREPAL